MILPIPNRCIWCHKAPPDCKFDISHVLPECVGNENQQVLPAGIVCNRCNNYFGTKVEGALLRDPLFHIAAVLLRLRDPDDMNEFRDCIFDREHKSERPVERNLRVSTQIASRTLTVDVDYAIKGQIRKSYQQRECALLSRAVHKIAFEALAWLLFVKGTEESIDIFDSRFDHVREWSRRGQPNESVRPIFRLQRFESIKSEWENRFCKFGDSLGMELNLFGDWYLVSLTSPTDTAGDDLKKWLGPKKPDNIWCVGKTLSLVT